MKLIIKDQQKANHFTTIFQNIKQITDNIAIYFSDEGLYIQGMDSTQICLFECKLTNEWFDHYEFSTCEDDPKICVNTTILCKVISAVDDKQTIELSYTGNTDMLHVKFGDTTENTFNKHFEIALIDIDSELMTIPREEAHVDLSIDTTKFSKLIQHLLIFSEVLTLTFTEEDIKFRASGTEGAMNSKIDLDDVHEYAIGEGLTLSQSYNLTYINMMCNFNKLNRNVVMGFSNNMPMSLTYSLDTIDSENTTEDADTVSSVTNKDKTNVATTEDDVFSDEDEDDDDDKDNDTSNHTITNVFDSTGNKCFVGFYLAPKLDEDEF